MEDDEIIRDVTDAQLDQARKDIEAEGYSIIDEEKGPKGLWTIQIRKDAANGAPQTAEGDDAVQQPQQPQAPQKPTPAAQPPEAGGKLTLGPDGERLIKAFESCAKKLGPNRFGVYRDCVKVPTIGWGHTNQLGRQFNVNEVWTQAECDAQFLSDMQVFEAQVHKLVKVPLNQRQFDALVSFCYNCGPGNLASSTLLRRVNERDFDAAAQQFGRWVKARGQTLNGLVRRRKYEARLFLGYRDLTYP
jgi:lysozyme